VKHHFQNPFSISCILLLQSVVTPHRLCRQYRRSSRDCSGWPNLQDKKVVSQHHAAGCSVLLPADSLCACPSAARIIHSWLGVACFACVLNILKKYFHHISHAYAHPAAAEQQPVRTRGLQQGKWISRWMFLSCGISKWFF